VDFIFLCWGHFFGRIVMCSAPALCCPYNQIWIYVDSIDPFDGDTIVCYFGCLYSGLPCSLQWNTVMGILSLFCKMGTTNETWVLLENKKKDIFKKLCFLLQINWTIKIPIRCRRNILIWNKDFFRMYSLWFIFSKFEFSRRQNSFGLFLPITCSLEQSHSLFSSS
jgi:hypothetical protein